MREKPTNTNYSFSLLIIYGSSHMFWHYIAIVRARSWCLLRDDQSQMRSQIATHHVTRHNTPIHNILSNAPQLIISQKALGTLPEDGNVMPKHVGATIHN